MRILADEATGIAIFLGLTACEREEFVELCRKLLAAPHEPDEVGHVLRHVETILPGISLGIRIAAVAAILQRIERLNPPAIAVLCTSLFFARKKPVEESKRLR